MTDNMRMTPAALGAALRGDLPNALIAATPGGIERQEAEGQRQMASSFRTLPKEMDRAPAEAFGFKFLADADEIFVNVIAPEGWQIRPTEHSMHSDIVDAKGRTRGGIFYKAAFYDRRAHGHWSRRYRIEPGKDVTGMTEAFNAVDTATGKIIFSELVTITPFEEKRWEREDRLTKILAAKMDERFPDWQDVTAYWD